MKKFTIKLLFVLPTLLFYALNGYYSQFGQDKFVNEKYFGNKLIGVCIEIGAHNGRDFSNSLFFDEILGWICICVEPSPRIFQELIRNRKCICINGCISNITGPAKFMFIDSGYNIATMYSGLVDKYDPRHLETIEKYFSNDRKTIIEVQCYRLNDILDEYHITHVDYLSLDTEGGEFDILTSIDFEKVTIDVIDVENNYNDSNIREFLESKGYQFVTRIVCDEIYKRIE